tara:strand:+ start:35913 stop:37373 length:1461 start_codon:yes stop_codon:yes gene_type:complete
MSPTNKEPDLALQSVHSADAAAGDALYITSHFAGTQLAAKTLRVSNSPGGARWRSKRVPSQAFRLGAATGADFALTGVSSHALLEVRGDRFILRFAPHWRGWLSTDAGTCTLRDLIDRGLAACSDDPEIFETVLPRHGTLRIEWGQRHLCIRPERQPAPLPRPTQQLASHPLVRPMLASSAIFLGILCALAQIPVSETYLAEADVLETERLVRLQSETLAAERKKNAPAETLLQKPQPAATNAQLETRETLSSISQGASEEPLYDPQETRAEAIRQARQAGIVALIPGAGGLGSEEFDAFVASIAFDASAENIETYGTLRPGDLGEATGAWGHGIRKMGPGSGDGKDYGTVKVGGFQLGGVQPGLAEFEANALTRPHKKLRPSISEGADAIIDSGFGYDAIRGQLGLRKRKLRRCFEDDLSRDVGPPSHLRMAFRISAEGTVEDAEAADIEESGIRSCVEKTLLSIHFPKPDDGKPLRIKDFSLRI